MSNRIDYYYDDDFNATIFREQLFNALAKSAADYVPVGVIKELVGDIESVMGDGVQDIDPGAYFGPVVNNINDEADKNCAEEIDALKMRVDELTKRNAELKKKKR